MSPNHYVSLKIAQELKKAGIWFKNKHTTTFVRRENPKTNWFGKWELVYQKNIMQWLFDYDLSNYKGGLVHQEMPTYSLSEIMDELPGYAVVYLENKWTCGKIDKTNSYYVMPRWKGTYKTADIAPDAAAKMLIELKTENNYV